MMILWIVLIIAFMYYLGRGNGYFNSHHNNQHSHRSELHKDSSIFSKRKPNRENIIDINDDQALKIARKRYAEGELNKDEFEEIKKNLEK